jgi:hypothetical protein
MPPARKPAARGSSRSTASPSPTRPITRKEVEAATARFEKALDEAGHALQAMGADLGKGGKSAYREIERSLKTLRTQTTRTNRSLLKDFDKLRAAVTPSKSTSRSAGARASATKAAVKAPVKSPAKAPAKTAAKAPARSPAKTAAKAPAKTPARSTGSRATPSRSTRTTARKPTR